MIKVRDGKMNKKGQALVEFIIILPVFIFMLLAMIDIGKILYFNNKCNLFKNQPLDYLPELPNIPEPLSDLKLFTTSTLTSSILTLGLYSIAAWQ